MAALPWFTVAGVVVGMLFGLVGVGGSSFATPALALLGVHGVIAIASPLPATIPAALAGAWTYLRRRECDCRVVVWSLTGNVPGTMAGALLSRFIGGRALLVASGVVLGIVGVRVLRPVTDDQRTDGKARRRAGIVVPAAAVIGVFTGLLAKAVASSSSLFTWSSSGWACASRRRPALL